MRTLNKILTGTLTLGVALVAMTGCSADTSEPQASEVPTTSPSESEVVQDPTPQPVLEPSSTYLEVGDAVADDPDSRTMADVIERGVMKLIPMRKSWKPKM